MQAVTAVQAAVVLHTAMHTVGCNGSCAERSPSTAGQAVVQFAVDPRDGREFAVKFFLQEEAFRAEAALYTACFPSVRTSLSPALLHARSRYDSFSLHPGYGAQPQLSSAQPITPQQQRNGTLSDIPNELHVGTSIAASRSQYESLSVACDASVRVDVGAGHGTDAALDSAGSETGKLMQDHGDGPAAVSGRLHERAVGGGSSGPSGSSTVFQSALSTVPVEAAAVESIQRSADAFQRMPQAAAKFLPQVETVCDDAVDPRGRPLPPCIVMEKGESLQDWSNRAEPDLFTSVAVRLRCIGRSNICDGLGC